MRRILRYLGRHGLWRTTHRVVHAACNRALPYHAFAVMWMPASFEPEARESVPERFQISKLTREEAFDVSRLPGTDMPEMYVHDALDRGDECLGVVIDDEPACVCWFARRGPVALYRWWNVEFLGEYVYVHGAFTVPGHRGKRLLEQNLRAAVARYAVSGVTDMFALVESSNYASLNAFRRAGYVQRAKVRTAKIKGRFVVRHDSECLNAHVFVTPRPSLKTAGPSRETLTPAA
ncbi:MAG: GNAT family N-acetyltransferase [Candidatus Acidiferrales bacterium]